MIDTQDHTTIIWSTDRFYQYLADILANIKYNEFSSYLKKHRELKYIIVSLYHNELHIGYDGVNKEEIKYINNPMLETSNLKKAVSKLILSYLDELYLTTVVTKILDIDELRKTDIITNIIEHFLLFMQISPDAVNDGDLYLAKHLEIVSTCINANLTVFIKKLKEYPKGLLNLIDTLTDYVYSDSLPDNDLNILMIIYRTIIYQLVFAKQTDKEIVGKYIYGYGNLFNQLNSRRQISLLKINYCKVSAKWLKQVVGNNHVDGNNFEWRIVFNNKSEAIQLINDMAVESDKVSSYGEDDYIDEIYETFTKKDNNIVFIASPAVTSYVQQWLDWHKMISNKLMPERLSKMRTVLLKSFTNCHK